MRGIGVALAGIAIVGAFVLASTSRPAAAQSAPASFYGRSGVNPGDRVEASIGGRVCGANTVNSLGEWAIHVQVTSSCLPTEGAAVTFTVNGGPATIAPSAVWKVGGTPPNVANGYVLTTSSGATPTPTPLSTPVASASVLSGSIPRSGGYGLVVFTTGGDVEELVEATGCPRASMALYATLDGGFVTYVPGTTVGAVNAAFLTLFAGGRIGANTAFVGRCA
jgi:hypothetical protein